MASHEILRVIGGHASSLPRIKSQRLQSFTSRTIHFALQIHYVPGTRAYLRNRKPATRINDESVMDIGLDPEMDASIWLHRSTAAAMVNRISGSRSNK
jgi:hypothetical protein